MQEKSAAQRTPFRLFTAVLSRPARTQMVADMMVALTLPALNAAYQAQERSSTVAELTRVAAALAVVAPSRGSIPRSWLPWCRRSCRSCRWIGMPTAPLRYERKSDGGYLLYSVFENGQDDGGTDFGGEIVAGEWVSERGDVDYQQSDLVFRVPVPRFELAPFPAELRPEVDSAAPRDE